MGIAFPCLQCSDFWNLRCLSRADRIKERSEFLHCRHALWQRRLLFLSCCDQAAHGDGEPLAGWVWQSWFCERKASVSLQLAIPTAADGKNIRNNVSENSWCSPMSRSLQRQQQKHYSKLHFITLPFTAKCRLVDISCKCTLCITHWFGWRDRQGRAPYIDTVRDCKSQDCGSCKRQFNNQGSEPDACEMCQKKTTHTDGGFAFEMIFQGRHCWNACRTPLLHRAPSARCQDHRINFPFLLRAPDWQCQGAPLVWPVLFLTVLLPDGSELFSKAKSTSGDEGDCSFPS